MIIIDSVIMVAVSTTINAYRNFVGKRLGRKLTETSKRIL
jgi:hypothetical protein